MNPVAVAWLSLVALLSPVVPSIIDAPSHLVPEPLTLTAPPVAPLPTLVEGAVEPVVNAKSALLVDLPSQTTLYAKNPDDSRPIASLTKLMTALLAVERTQPNDIVTVPKLGTTTEESRMGLTEGQHMRAQDLLAGLLVSSANDAAVALAIHIAGSEKEFTEQMNKRAEEMGLKRTHFANPIGLDQEGNYSSAADLAVLARAAIAQSRISDVVGNKELTVTSVEGQPFTIRSTDELLGSYLPIAGLKTGTTDAAGPCLISVVDTGQRKLLAIVLNSPNRFQENKSMLDWGLNSHQW